MDFLDNLKNYEIVLMSQSPRRRELLQEMGLRFSVAHSDADETYPSDLEGNDIPMYLSANKAAAYKPFMKENTLVIAADTIVFLNQKALGKPSSREDAISMLKELSNCQHEVITGITIMTNYEKVIFSEKSIVEFSELSDKEIIYYVDKYSPYDKAGAYGIQEWIGMIGIKNIQGSYYNIMGLPIHRLFQELKCIEPYNRNNQ